MILFNKRHGYQEEQPIQFESISKNLRMRIYNFIISEINEVQPKHQRQIMDYLRKEYFIIRSDTPQHHLDVLIKDEIFEVKWFDTFSLLELLISMFQHYRPINYKDSNEHIKEINRIFTVESSAYRFLDGVIIPITNDSELESLRESVSTKYDAVNTHFSKALNFYSDRTSPDYSNSIKESISAVESMCCIIADNDKAVLSSALDKLKKKGVVIHRAQIDAFKKLYGYTSDENGIRHAGIDFKTPNASDAKYMLVSCSAFVNYLIEKYNTE